MAYPELSDLSIKDTFNSYLDEIAQKRDPATFRNYKMAINNLCAYWEQTGIDIHVLKVSQISDNWIIEFFKNLKNLSPNTVNVYFFGILGWYKTLESKRFENINPQRLSRLVRSKIPKPSKHTLRPPNYHNLSRVVNYALNLKNDIELPSENKQLRLLRNRALIVLLADTGIESTIIPHLRKSDLDWENNRIKLSNKNGKTSFIDFSPRVGNSLLDYLNLRIKQDKRTGRGLGTLPIFSRHGANFTGQVLPLSSRGVREAVADVASEALGVEDDGSITPKSLSFILQTLFLYLSLCYIQK